MSVEAIADRYAQALLDIGVERGNLATVAQDLEHFAELYGATPELRTVLDNPLVPEANREGILRELLERLGTGEVVVKTLQLLARRNRLGIVPAMARRLLKMSDAREGVLRARVVSAKPLTDAYAGQMQSELEKLTGKKVVLTREVDTSLIAGVVTRVGDTVIDGSLRTRLEQLRAQLLATQV